MIPAVKVADRRFSSLAARSTKPSFVGVLGISASLKRPVGHCGCVAGAPARPGYDPLYVGPAARPPLQRIRRGTSPFVFGLLLRSSTAAATSGLAWTPPPLEDH